jgi:hypothetical protein
MFKKNIRVPSFILFIFFLVLILLSACGTTEKYKPTISKGLEHSKVFIYRPKDLLTITQGVELSVDGKIVDKIWHGKTIMFTIDQGIHEIQTSVGLSIGFPNVTGFSGARPFEKKFKFNKKSHYFKILFKAGLLGGKHTITEINPKEFTVLTK